MIVYSIYKSLQKSKAKEEQKKKKQQQGKRSEEDNDNGEQEKPKAHPSDDFILFENTNDKTKSPSQASSNNSTLTKAE
jgi:sRNA-binding protein